MGWLIVFAILSLIAWIPLGVSVLYNAEGFRVKAVVGIVRITVFPLPHWLKHKKKSPSKSDKIAEEHKEKPKEKETGGSLSDFLPFVKLGLDLLNAFRKKLRINCLNLKLTMAADDPCDLAINYGRAWAAVGNLTSAMERVFVIQKRNVDVGCDFTAESTVIYANVDLTITVGRILAIGFIYGIRAVKEFIKFKKKREKAVQAS